MEFDVNLEDLKNIYKIKSLVETDSGFKRYVYNITEEDQNKYGPYRDWETDRKSTRLNSSHSAKSRMPSSA